MPSFRAFILTVFFVSQLSSRAAFAQEQREAVSFVGHVTALEAIKAIGAKTHTPIGIIPGRDTASLCGAQYAFDFRETDVSEALTEIAHRSQYSLSREGDVFVFIAPDLTLHQSEVFNHRFAKFDASGTMHQISSQLASFLWSDAHPDEGYGGSILDSPAAPTISLPTAHNVATKEIANRVATTQGGGMWISKVHPTATEEINEFQIELESYEHLDQLEREISCPW